MWASKSTSKTVHSAGGNVRVCAYGDNREAKASVVVQEMDEAVTALKE